MTLWSVTILLLKIQHKKIMSMLSQIIVRYMHIPLQHSSVMDHIMGK